MHRLMFSVGFAFIILGVASLARDVQLNLEIGAWQPTPVSQLPEYYDWYYQNETSIDELERLRWAMRLPISYTALTIGVVSILCSFMFEP